MNDLDLNSIVKWFRTLQDHICSGLEALDGTGQFSEEIWTRQLGGGGRSRVIQAEHIEKGGVMFSHVYGTMPEAIAAGLEMSPGFFNATGVSIVLHPLNPWVPIIHMNVRYFEKEGGDWWFGGGIDVTPHYIDRGDAKEFHQILKEICDRFDSEAYAKYKTWADDYFYNRHRSETRGIGGIFFDRLNSKSGHTKHECWQFVKDVGSSFLICYENLFNQNFNKDYSEEEVLWRNIRRSRYVEFNLVYDRGTKFGLQTDGRVESILMSMPPVAQWLYDHKPGKGSQEDDTQALLKKGIDWVTDTVT